MESFVLNWPSVEQWKISHSSVEGDGRTVVFELVPQSPSIDGEHALELIWIAKEKPVLEDFFEKWIADFSQNQEHLKLQVFPEKLSYPSKIFLLDHLNLQNKDQSGIGFMVSGENSILLHLNFFPSAFLSEAVIQKRLDFFNTLRIKAQSLQDSLKESSLLPEVEVPVEENSAQNEKITLSQSNIIPDRIRKFAHPLHLEDFPYWEINIDEGRMEVFWARILKEVGHGLFVAMDLADETSKSFYLRWDTARNAFFKISSKGLTLLEGLVVDACKACRFESIDPATIQKSENYPLTITCPFCGGEIIISPNLPTSQP